MAWVFFCLIFFLLIDISWLTLGGLGTMEWVEWGGDTFGGQGYVSQFLYLHFHDILNAWQVRIHGGFHYYA